MLGSPQGKRAMGIAHWARLFAFQKVPLPGISSTKECKKQFQGRNIVSSHMVCIQLQLQSCLASSPEHCNCYSQGTVCMHVQVTDAHKDGDTTALKGSHSQFLQFSMHSNSSGEGAWHACRVSSAI